MNVTFLIGNGFDLNLGLKTRYTDFYDYFIQHASKGSIILQLMMDDRNKENWSDLELALGEKVKIVGEDKLDSFMDAHEDLDSLLLEYLEEEQSKYSVDKNINEIISELARSLTELKNELTDEEQESFQNTFNAHRSEDFNYSFITFNYTDILDQFIKKAKSGNMDLGSHIDPNGRNHKHLISEVHHVHGTLFEGVVLGVNDETQINNDFFRQQTMFKDVFLKSNINKKMGERRTEHADEIINRSQIICIFGMSMGITDKRWWQKIISWLVSNSDRKLIIFAREDERLLKRKIPTRIIRAKDGIIRNFWEKGRGNNPDAIFEQIRTRIFVIFNSKIFSFPKI